MPGTKLGTVDHTWTLFTSGFSHVREGRQVRVTICGMHRRGIKLGTDDNVGDRRRGTDSDI